MDTVTERVPANVRVTFLAGLQAGMVAVFWMLVWLGISAMWMRRSFWSPVNIMSTVLHGDAGIHPGFASTTPSGIALYLVIYSMLGAVFALLVGRRLTGWGTLLTGILFSLIWYWFWFRFLALRAMPLVWLLHPEGSTQFGHVLYGALLARFGDYLPARRHVKAVAEPGIEGQAPAGQPDLPH
jgi:hypothetical protein